MRLSRRILLLLLLILAALPSPAQAQTSGRLDCSALSTPDWREALTQSFAVVYPVEYESLGRTLAGPLGETLDAEYARFAALYRADLTLPLTLRIYPSIDHYTCLNSQPAPLAPGATHGRSGGREIALLGNAIAARGEAWLAGAREVFRYELGALFAQQVSGGKAPPGLVSAAGAYAQDPQETIARLHLSPGDWLAAHATWDELWENPAAEGDLRAGLEAASSVAYLVDVFGWEAWLRFLNELSTADSYRAALAKTYGSEFSALQLGWQSYLPHYFRYRWQTHALYNFDLSPHSKLIREEKYAQAIQGLNEATAFLEKTGEGEKLAQARGLLLRARGGQEADVLVAEMRQAIYAGEYERAVQAADAAALKYSQAGNLYRIDELNALRGQVRQILGLHQRLDRLQAQVQAGSGPVSLGVYRQWAELVSLAEKMSALGDLQGHTQAQALASTLEARQQSLGLALGAAASLLVLFLLGIRILMARIRAPIETEI